MHKQLSIIVTCKTAAIVAILLLSFYAGGWAEQFQTLNPNNNAMALYPEQKCVSCHIGENDLPKGKHKRKDLYDLVKRSDCQECHLTFHKQPLKNPGPKHEPIKQRILEPGKYTADSPPYGMVYVPAGEFIMGSDERMPDERPEYIATTNAFFIDINEITNEDYLIFLRANNRPLPSLLQNGEVPFGLKRHPVTFVTWYESRDFCAYNGKRLPTESEWEKSARGTKGFWFPWGNEFKRDMGNVPQLGIGSTTPVGSFPQGKSPYGLNDMSGNVWEWVDSVYLPHPGNPDTEDENYSDRFKLLKGGSWVDCHFYNCGISAPTFNRSFFVPETKNKGFGFRCAMNAPKNNIFTKVKKIKKKPK